MIIWLGVRFYTVPVIHCVVHTTPAMTIYILIIPRYIYLLSPFLFSLSYFIFWDYEKTVFVGWNGGDARVLLSLCHLTVLPDLRGSCPVRQKEAWDPVAASWLGLLAHQNTQINIKYLNQKNSVHTSNWCMEYAKYCLETPSNLEWNVNRDVNTTNFKTRGSLKLFSSVALHCRA
jgi:hypothetical protein